jgi:AsmA protein
MKKTFFFIAVFLAFMFAVANLLLFFPPTGYARSLLIAGVRKSTGLELAVNGRLTLKLMPSIDLRMDDIVVSNPANPGSKPLLTARSLEVGTGFWPLLRGSREIARVSLTGPQLTVAIDKDGNPGWNMPSNLGTGPGDSTPRDNVSGATTNNPAGGEPSRSSFLIDRLTIADGIVAVTDARSGMIARAEKASGTLRGVAANRIAEAVVDNASLEVRDGQAGTTLKFPKLSATARRLSLAAIDEVSAEASGAEWLMPKERQRVALAGIKARAEAYRLSGSGGRLAVSSTTLTWTDDAGTSRVAAQSIELVAKSFDTTSLRDVAIKTATVAIGAPSSRDSDAKTSTPPPELKQVSATAAEISRSKPIDTEIAFLWNGERLAGRAKLPAPDAMSTSASVPASLSLASTKGSLDLDGALTTTGSTTFRGKAEAATPALDELAGWLGKTRLPKQLAGPAGATGTVEATPTRIALSAGRIEHGRAVATGSLIVDLSGDRPKLTGNLSSDRIDADSYLGLTPVKPVTRSSPPEPAVDVVPQVPVTEALKASLRAMLSAPVTRSGQLETDVSLSDLMGPATTRAKTTDFEWSNDKFDLSPLRTFDLDLDLSVKALSLRGFDIAVPQLKTVLKDGRLTLDGNNLSTRGGRLSGNAEIDASQKSPKVATSFKADGIDVYDLMKSAGATGLIAGTSTVEAKISGAGASQREIVGTLTGDVKTRMGSGQIVGYDFSSVASWLFGARKYDPRNRTPFTRLDADIRLDKGIARKSVVKLEGPVIGVDGDGTIRLVQQELDYRARLKLLSLTLFRNVAVRVFGDWSKPSVAPDLDIFSRSPAETSNPAEVLAEADLKDAELDSLIGQVLQKAGSRGLDPALATTLRSLQQRARGER